MWCSGRRFFCNVKLFHYRLLGGECFVYFSFVVAAGKRRDQRRYHEDDYQRKECAICEQGENCDTVPCV